jgi:hypothetical protein
MAMVGFQVAISARCCRNSGCRPESRAKQQADDAGEREADGLSIWEMSVYQKVILVAEGT